MQRLLTLKRLSPGPKRRKAKIWSSLMLVVLLMSFPLPGGGHSLIEEPGTEPAFAHASAIILFIGDGMGAEQRKAGQWLTLGMDGQLEMDQLPVQGWSRTGSADNPITDSAAGATATSTGVKTNNGYVAMDPGGLPLRTILEMAHLREYATGLITTVQISHATPAAFGAHVLDRNQMTEIASQLLDEGVEVLLGGGEDEFQPPGTTGCFSQAGERGDGRDLTDEAVAAGYTYVCDEAGFDAIDPLTVDKILGLFADEQMDRPFSPSLADMTQKAIDILQRNSHGFFLMVESGQIDWAAHANDAVNTMGDVVGLDAAVKVALAYAALHPDTMVIIAADHETGGMEVSLTSTGAPGEDGPFLMPDNTPFYVRWATTGHTGQDIPVTAMGPRGSWLSGTYENTHIFTAMSGGLNWWVWLPVISKP